MQWPDHVRSMADINLGLRNEALKITDRDHGFMQTRTGETHITDSWTSMQQEGPDDASHCMMLGSVIGGAKPTGSSK
jgi:hypothetical protein